MGHDKVKAKHVRQGRSSSVNSPGKATRLADVASIPLSSDLPCAQRRPSWGCSPAVPGRTQKSGSLGTHRTPAGGYREAPPGCGSAPGSLPRMTSHLHSRNEGLQNPLQGRTEPSPIPELVLIPFPPAYLSPSIWVGIPPAGCLA